MKQLEFSLVATLLVLPSFFQLIISLLLLLSSAYIVRFHTPSHGTDTRSKQKLIMNAYEFSIAPFPSLSFLLPPFISIYFYDSYLEVLHHVVSWLSSYLFIVLRGQLSFSVTSYCFCTSLIFKICTSIPDEQAQIAAL